MLNSDNYIIHNINFVSESVLQVYYSYEKDFIEQSSQTNVALAAFVTSYARLKLYSEMKKLNKRLLYCDTDSLIFVSKHLVIKMFFLFCIISIKMIEKKILHCIKKLI